MLTYSNKYYVQFTRMLLPLNYKTVIKFFLVNNDYKITKSPCDISDDTTKNIFLCISMYGNNKKYIFDTVLASHVRINCNIPFWC